MVEGAAQITATPIRARPDVTALRRREPVGVLGYAISRTTNLSFEEAVAHARAALVAEGFSVPCEIDLQRMVREQFGEEQEPYVLLGACDAPLGGSRPQVLLPLNVAVYVDGGETRVAVVDMAALLGIAGHPELDRALGEVRERLARALEAAA